MRLEIMCPRGYTNQLKYYNGWTKQHNCNNVMWVNWFILFLIDCIFIIIYSCFGPDGNIIGYAINAPGSYHDSKVFKSSSLRDKIEDIGNKGYSILCDSGFCKMKGLVSTRKYKNETSDDAELRK